MYSTVLLALSVVCVDSARIVCLKGMCATVFENEGSKLFMNGQQCNNEKDCDQNLNTYTHPIEGLLSIIYLLINSIGECYYAQK